MYFNFEELLTVFFLQQELVPIVKDLSEEYNNTTLGPYSFQVFVQAAVTKNKFEVLQNQKTLAGHRPAFIVGHGCRKRPLSDEIAKRSGDERKGKRARKENLLAVKEDSGSNRVLRSGKRF